MLLSHWVLQCPSSVKGQRIAEPESGNPDEVLVGIGSDWRGTMLKACNPVNLPRLQRR